MELKIKKLNDKAVIPSYAHDGDVGMDLTAINVEYDAEHDMYIYHTGLSVETEKGYGVFIFLRSSNRKTDCYMCNHVGIVDSAIYRGEILICVKNRDSLQSRVITSEHNRLASVLIQRPISAIRESVDTVLDKLGISFNAIRNTELENPLAFAPYKPGERIAQMVVLPYPKVEIKEVTELSETDRGTGGFGSTGN